MTSTPLTPSSNSVIGSEWGLPGTVLHPFSLVSTFRQSGFFSYLSSLRGDGDVGRGLLGSKSFSVKDFQARGWYALQGIGNEIEGVVGTLTS